jgi:hypothetical protein
MSNHRVISSGVAVNCSRPKPILAQAYLHSWRKIATLAITLVAMSPHHP